MKLNEQNIFLSSNEENRKEFDLNNKLTENLHQFLEKDLSFVWQCCRRPLYDQVFSICLMSKSPFGPISEYNLMALI